MISPAGHIRRLRGDVKIPFLCPQTTKDMSPRSASGLQQTLCERSHMVVGAKVCELTDGFLWFVCGLYVGILTSPLKGATGSYQRL